MRTVLIASAVCLAAAVAEATVNTSPKGRLSAAARVVRNVQPTIPAGYWDKARCVAVFPEGEEHRLRRLTGWQRRDHVPDGRWSAPAFIEMDKGKRMFQLGAEQLAVVLLVMTESAVQTLMRQHVTLGTDVSVAPGPIGDQAHIDFNTHVADVLTYTRAQGFDAPPVVCWSPTTTRTVNVHGPRCVVEDAARCRARANRCARVSCRTDQPPDATWRQRTVAECADCSVAPTGSGGRAGRRCHQPSRTGRGNAAESRPPSRGSDAAARRHERHRRPGAAGHGADRLRAARADTAATECDPGGAQQAIASPSTDATASPARLVYASRHGVGWRQLHPARQERSRSAPHDQRPARRTDSHAAPAARALRRDADSSSSAAAGYGDLMGRGRRSRRHGNRRERRTGPSAVRHWRERPDCKAPRSGPAASTSPASSPGRSTSPTTVG